MAGKAKNGISGINFEKAMRAYLKMAREKLADELPGTREAIKLIAAEKIRYFIEMMDKGLSKEERELLKTLIISGMHQSFCYGYGIGRIEENSNEKIFL